MDCRIKTMREKAIELKEGKAYFFHFENIDSEQLAVVIWHVKVSTGKQVFTLSIDNGELEQLRDLFITYLSAKQFAERFDLDMIIFLFEQYAQNENIDIICD